MTGTLILLRHGESAWNATNQFTGWWDVELTARGEAEARRSGELLAGADLLPDVAHTSVLTRAIRSANLALAQCGRPWLPVRRSWRLNERHYGDLQGKDKARVLAEYGEEQFTIWRRSYDTPPPPIALDNPYTVVGDARYARLAPDVLPATECLADVVARMLPYWFDAIVPELRAGENVLVTAHGNSLRALIKHLDRISAADIVGVNIPTGNPLVYRLDEQLRPTEPARYLDPEAAAAGAAAVAAQGR